MRPSLGSLTCSSIISANRSPQSVATYNSCRKANSLSDFSVLTRLTSQKQNLEYRAQKTEYRRIRRQPLLFILSPVFCLLFFIIFAVLQRLRQTPHLFTRARVAMDVAIAAAVADLFHQGRDGVAQVERDGLAGRLCRVRER